MNGMTDSGDVLWGMGWIDLSIIAVGALVLAALTKYLFFRARIAAKP